MSKNLIILSLLGFSSGAFAESNINKGFYHFVSRANCGGINESVTWNTMGSADFSLRTVSEHHNANDNMIHVYMSTPSWGDSRAWAGCSFCFGRVYRVRGLHYLEIRSGDPYFNKKIDEIRTICGGSNPCGITIAFGCSLMPN